MSYPSIGMKGFGPPQGWNNLPSAVEQLLRDGHHIYEEDDRSYSMFDEEKQKFAYVIPKSTNKNAKDFIQEFDTFAEMAVWVAFYGKDFI